ncbi:MAG: toxin-antitoxin system, antitoxin component, Xre family protein [Acidobacteriota bacterium]|nr:toxin-antitoxin system, antitoxin component, Xre family protein [Acidobacteriota bacterium]
MQTESLIERIKSLPPERINEVEAFVDFIAERDERRLAQAATKMSEGAFHNVWDNEEDAAYDRL